MCVRLGISQPPIMHQRMSVRARAGCMRVRLRVAPRKAQSMPVRRWSSPDSILSNACRRGAREAGHSV